LLSSQLLRECLLFGLLRGCLLCRQFLCLLRL
jgi:hypothetical protein